MRTWLAHTQYEYARMLLAQDAGRPRDSAPEPRRRARRRHRHERALEPGCGVGRADPPASLPDELSEREAQVLGLVARGLSNREIGSALFISEHTAANHIRSILRKTSCANRTEAASYAHRYGLAATESRG